MLNPDPVLQPEFPTYFSRPFQCLTIDRIAQVEADEWRRTIFPGKESCCHQSPKNRKRVIITHEDRNLKLHIDSQFVKKVTEKDCSWIDIEHLLDSILGVII